MGFLTSIGVLLLSGLVLGSILKKLNIPSLLGALIIGIVLGPYVLNIISPDLLNISADIRKIALVIILTRAGLSFDFNELKKNGRSAVMMCFVPALFEICGYMIFGTLLLQLTIVESAILGSVMAAVSPAVVVPRMLKIREEGYGVSNGVPQMVMAGASADDIFVIILFTSLVATGGTSFDLNILWKTPVSIILGIGVGIGVGLLLSLIMKKVNFTDMMKVVVLLSLSLVFVGLESIIEKYVPFSALLAVIAVGAVLYKKDKEGAIKLSAKYNDLWTVFEIMLFALVGMVVDPQYALTSSGMILLVIMLAMIFRMAGVYVCVMGTKLTFKERVFCMIAYIPKATVQAAIGAIPLSLGLPCGQVVLTAAVLSILITAPIGAFLTDILYKKLLKKDNEVVIELKECNQNT